MVRDACRAGFVTATTAAAVSQRVCVLRTDHVTLPAIKPANQQSNQRHGLSPNTNSSQVQQYVVASNTPAAPGSLGPKQPDDTLFPAGRQHKTAAGPGMEHHMLASHLLHATNTQSRASTSSRRASSSSHASSRPRTQQQRDEAEEGTIHAQQQLQQLYGNSSTCSPEREAAAGGRILALPFAICTAADGSLYEVATGHVQLMMLRRQLAAAGIDLTDEEAALLTSGVRWTADRQTFELHLAADTAQLPSCTLGSLIPLACACCCPYRSRHICIY